MLQLGKLGKVYKRVSAFFLKTSSDCNYLNKIGIGHLEPLNKTTSGTKETRLKSKIK